MLTTNENTEHLITAVQLHTNATRKGGHKNTPQGPLITSPGEANLQDVSFLF